MGLKPISTISFSPDCHCEGGTTEAIFPLFFQIKCCNIAIQNYKYEIQSYTLPSSSPVNTGQMQYVYMKIYSGFAILQTLFFYIY